MEHCEYDAFGAIDQVFDEIGGALYPWSLQSDFGFAGRAWDYDAGLYYNRARWYEPTSGRFINEDPAQDGSNWYVYADNNPFSFVDPSGLSVQSPLNNLFGPSASTSFGVNSGPISIPNGPSNNFGLNGNTLTSTSSFNFSSLATPATSSPTISSTTFDFNGFTSAFNPPKTVRFADQFNNTRTVTDGGGQTRLVADIGGQQVAFSTVNGAETGELLHTIRGESGGSFQRFATPSLAEKLVIFENPSTQTLALQAATGGVAATTGRGAVILAREAFETGVELAIEQATGVSVPVHTGRGFRPSRNLGAVENVPSSVSSGGRLGSVTTRQHVSEIASELKRRGYEVTGGGGVRPEEYIPGRAGRRGSAFPDITATKDGRTVRINTIDTLTDAITPTAREARNAAKIRQLKPNEHLLLVPKPKQ